MKATALFVILILGGCLPRSQNMQGPAVAEVIPLALWVDYSEGEGADYRLQHAKDLCVGETITQYTVNWRFDPEAKYQQIDISRNDWARFRESLINIRTESWKDQNFDESKAERFWTFYVEYPDRVIRGSSADSATTISDFAAMRLALHELTGGKAF